MKYFFFCLISALLLTSCEKESVGGISTSVKFNTAFDASPGEKTFIADEDSGISLEIKNLADGRHPSSETCDHKTFAVARIFLSNNKNASAETILRIPCHEQMATDSVTIYLDKKAYTVYLLDVDTKKDARLSAEFMVVER